LKRITDYLSTLGLVLIMPAWLLYYLKIEPRRRQSCDKDLQRLEVDLLKLGMSPAAVPALLAALRGEVALQDKKRRELAEHLANPLTLKLAIGVLIFIALFAAGLSLLSHGRIPLFVGLPSGYLAVCALLAGLYEAWKDDD
jgi:hypothetical protein